MRNQPVVNAEQINKQNKIRLLSLIREKEAVSRAGLVRLSGLSAPTVTRVVDTLINRDKLVVETGTGESSGGRPPTILRFNRDDSFVIGIDWGRTHILGILSNLNAEPLAKIDLATAPESDFNTDLHRVSGLIEELIQQSGINRDRLRGIGIAAAGFVNRHDQVVEYSPNFRWENANIRQPLHGRFCVPVIVENVSRAMAQGELIYGIGKEYKDFVFVNIGYGIGAGIIVNGKPFTGFDGFAGEFGHSRIASGKINSLLCVCGKPDCLENYSSGRGIAEIARQELAFHPHSTLSKMCGNDPKKIDSLMVAKSALEGDFLSLSLYHQAAEYLGIAIASLANIINPEVIVLGGKVLHAGDFFTGHIRRVFEREKLQQPKRKIELIKSPLADEAAVKGAISLILQEILLFNV